MIRPFQQSDSSNRSLGSLHLFNKVVILGHRPPVSVRVEVGEGADR